VLTIHAFSSFSSKAVSYIVASARKKTRQMSAPAPQKLTKKQKKGLAFRERKRNRGLTKDLNNSEPDDVPVMEDQDLAEAEPQAGRAQGQEEGEGLECVAVKPAPGIGDKRKGKSKGKDKEQGRDVVSLGQAKKRRRTDEGDADLALDVDGGELGPRRKKAQGSGQSTRQEKEEKDDCGEEGQAGSEEKPKKVEPKSGAKQRFILFVGMSVPPIPSED
jgi:nucleolar protein 6